MTDFNIEFPKLHYIVSGDCNCPYSKDIGNNVCHYCGGKNPKKEIKKVKRGNKKD